MPGRGRLDPPCVPQLFSAEYCMEIRSWSADTRHLGFITKEQAFGCVAIDALAKSMVPAQEITTGTGVLNVNHPNLSGNRPLAEADPAMVSLAQEGTA